MHGWDVHKGGTLLSIVDQGLGAGGPRYDSFSYYLLAFNGLAALQVIFLLEFKKFATNIQLNEHSQLDES